MFISSFYVFEFPPSLKQRQQLTLLHLKPLQRWSSNREEITAIASKCYPLFCCRSYTCKKQCLMLCLFYIVWCKWLAILIWEHIKKQSIGIVVQAPNTQHIFWNHMSQIARWLFGKYRVASEKFGERKFYFWPLVTSEVFSSRQEKYFRNKTKICLLMHFSISLSFKYKE